MAFGSYPQGHSWPTRTMKLNRMHQKCVTSRKNNSCSSGERKSHLPGFHECLEPKFISTLAKTKILLHNVKNICLIKLKTENIAPNSQKATKNEKGKSWEFSFQSKHSNRWSMFITIRTIEPPYLHNDMILSLLDINPHEFAFETTQKALYQWR